jgi:hypothetical protein
MAKGTPNDPHNVPMTSKYLNIILWVVIALVAALIGGWTIWASQQPNIRSIWAAE